MSTCASADAGSQPRTLTVGMGDGSLPRERMKPGAADPRILDQASAESRELTDEDLMGRFCQGEMAALDLLFRRHAQALRNFLVRLVGIPSAADDLTQVTFLSVVRSRDRFLKGARFKPWLYAIAANAARDARRRRSHEDVTDDGELPAQASSDVPGDPVLARRVARALSELPDLLRIPIVMHRFEAMSFGEIAEALQTTESTVKVRAHRGYKRLRELLGPTWEDVK